MSREHAFVKAPYSHDKGRTIYPFAKMDVGDWFLAPRDGRRIGPKNADHVQMLLLRAAYNWTRRNYPARRLSVTIWDDRRVLCVRVR